MKERFTQEEANEILMRAVETQPLGREVTREQLESLAAEIGVSLESLRAAEDHLSGEHTREIEERRIFQALQREHSQAVRRFAAHICVFLFFAFIFTMITLKEDDAAPIALAFMVPWFVWLVLHGMQAFRGGAAGHEKAFRKWQKTRRENDSLNSDDWAAAPRRLVR